MDQTIHAKEMQLYKVFSDDFIFEIPSLQRPYAWTTKEAGDLLDDLLSFIRENNITSKTIDAVSEPYFLGSFVLVKKESPHYEVLDGQQRLTTLTILLAVLRDYLGDEIGKSIHKRIVQQGDKVLGTKDTYRLKLRERDNAFFRKYIQQEGATSISKEDIDPQNDSQKRMIENAAYFNEYLVDLDEEEINVLPTVLAKFCYVVLVSTTTFNSAFRIFTVLNDRGMDLMYSDIYKATVIKDVIHTDQDRYSLMWEEVEASLGRNQFNQLFDHIRMIVQKRKGSQNSRDEFELIFKEVTGEKFIDQTLIPYSTIYEKILHPENYFRDKPRIMKLLMLMNQLDNNDWIPPAMYYMHLHKDDQKVEQFLRKLETLASTSMILRKNFNWRMMKYSRVLREIEKGYDVFSPYSNMNVSKEDQMELLNILRGDVYLDVANTAKRYLLLKIDSLLTQGQPFYEYNIITVEHVLPQNPREDSQWIKDFSNYQDHVHKLGNLVLLTRRKNAQASNYDFDKKKKSYFEPTSGINTFAITNQVIQESHWTEEVLKERQRRLIELLVNEWELTEAYKQFTNDSYCYLGSPQGADAVGVYDKETKTFTVKKGSRVSLTTVKSLRNDHRIIRESLISENILEKTGDALHFTEDYEFASPSTAASIVIGRNENGNKAWKLSNGKQLREVRDL